MDGCMLWPAAVVFQITIFRMHADFTIVEAFNKAPPQ